MSIASIRRFSGRGPFAARLGLVLSCWLGCGEKSSDENALATLDLPAATSLAEVSAGVPAAPPREATPAAPSSTPGGLGSGGTIITWGHTGILYKDHPGNLRLLHNVLQDLTNGVPRERAGRLLYTSECDPREDARFCQLADSLDELAGFFAALADFGKLEFRSPSSVRLSDYAAVIFDTCQASGGKSSLDAYLERGGRALILADNFCLGARLASARSANLVLQGFGLDFSDSDPGATGAYAVPAGQRKGLLEGVQSLDIFRVTPQRIEHSFTPVVQAPTGVLMARLHAD